MKTQIYSVFDSASSVHMLPFYAHTDGLAVRIILDASRDPQIPFAAHPHDFTLFHIGEYDDTSALLTSIVPTRLGTVHELLTAAKG